MRETTATRSNAAPAPAPAPASMDEVLTFMRLLWAVDHGLQAGSKRMKAELGVTGPQRLVLRILGQFPEIPAGQLATILHVHPSTLTGVLQRLAARGLIHRRVDPKDGRRALFHLTDKGKVLDRVRSGTVEALVRNTLGGLSPKKIAAAQEVLAALAGVLDVDGEE